VISESGVPSGFANIYDNITVTAHDTLLLPAAEFRNRNISIPITDFPPPQVVAIPPPDLTSDQFDLYKDTVQVGIFLGIRGPTGFSEPETVAAVGPFEIPAGRLETLATLAPPEITLKSVLFNVSAAPGTTAQDLFTSFRIPTYPDIDPSIVNDTFYFVPALVIPYGDSGNNYLLTPKIGHIQPGMTLVLEQPSYVESEEAKVERVNMTFNTAGTDIGFSFAITDERPPNTPPPPIDVPALFFDIDFVGDTNTQFSDPAAFQSSPIIDILVNKTLSGFEQLDGCADFQLFLLNENSNEWELLEKLRNPTKDTETQCGFTVETPHFSKFAVGGVRGQAVTTESVLPAGRHGGGGGGGGSTSIQQMTSGSNVESETRVGSDSVLITFDVVEPGSGQLKISTANIDKFTDMFDEITTEQGDKRGIVRLDDSMYSTAGRVFNVDASAVKFQGMVKVAIPYDEQSAQSLGSESNVRLLHYDETIDQWQDATIAIDTDKNTVTGMTNSLSPVVAAVIDDGTFPAIYFDMNPLNKVIAEDRSKVIANPQKGLETSIPVTIKNTQRTVQQYTVIVQVIDENGVARYVDWQSGSLARGQSVDISSNWTPEDGGRYTVQVFIWDKIDKPLAISKVAIMKLSVSD
jgi:hypothetical protein